jgi:hypothetical protein
MRLISILDVSDTATAFDEEVFRNSNTSNIIVFFVFSILIVICTYIFISNDYYRNGSVWSYVIYLWFLFWLGIFVWSAWNRFCACLLPSNWLVKSSSDRVLVKYRSFQNLNYAETDPVVIELPWRDINWIRKTKETSSKDHGDSTVTESFTYIDMKLNLSEAELQGIEAGLNEERKRKPPRSEVGDLKHELFTARKNKMSKPEIQELKERIRRAKAINKSNQKVTSIKHNDYPVRLIDNNILRVRWNGIKPKINKALKSLSLRTNLEQELKIDSDSTVDSLKGKDLDDMILDRIMKGDRFDVMALVKKHYGYNTTEAKKFIDEMTVKK